jgi:antitoxin component HigA of HigAB toxin-antitoxin module
MKTINTTFNQMVSQVPPEIKQEIDFEVEISNRIDSLMKKHRLTKLEFARKLGKRPSEITKWLSGQHNFTLRTISLLTTFFGEKIIVVKK